MEPHRIPSIPRSFLQVSIAPIAPREGSGARGSLLFCGVVLFGWSMRPTHGAHAQAASTHTHTRARAHLITHDTLRCPAPTLRTDSQKSKMPEIGNTGVAFDTIAREWRCKYTGPAGESASLKVVSAHRTHFSHMSHPTFPTSHLLFLFFKFLFFAHPLLSRLGVTAPQLLEPYADAVRAVKLPFQPPPIQSHPDSKPP